MSFLVDANVLSEPTRPAPNARVIAWLRTHEHELAVDPIIVGELRFGILILPRGRRRTRLERWFADVVTRIRCHPWEVETALRWAQLLADLRANGRSMPIKDSMVAGTALSMGLLVATRNLRDFEASGVSCVDPFAAS